MVITLPNNWRPRDYQMPAWKALEQGIKRALLIWHRRAGKDDVCLHWAATQALQRVGNYWHMLPEYSQARKSVWEAVNPMTGKRRIDEAFPKAIRKRIRNTDMFIEFVNGSTWQLVGSDSYDSLVGSPPIGMTASEWALSDPAAWAYLRPILRENNGWVVFITTPRNSTHWELMYDGAKDDPTWFCEVLRVEETGVLTSEQIKQEKQEYVRELGEEYGLLLFAQEWQCSFKPVSGDAIINPLWVDAAVDAHEKLNLTPRGEKVTAFDVADEGKDAKALVQRHGILIENLEHWKTGDVTDGIDKAFTLSADYGSDHFIYDNVGVGASVKVHVAKSFIPKMLTVMGFGGNEQVDDPNELYEKDKQNKDVFRNKRAQYWWHLRKRFENTYRAVVKKEYGIDGDNLISISSKCKYIKDLKVELARVSRKRSLGSDLIQIISKEEMRRQGIPSPNLADALVMSFANKYKQSDYFIESQYGDYGTTDTYTGY